MLLVMKTRKIYWAGGVHLIIYQNNLGKKPDSEGKLEFQNNLKKIKTKMEDQLYVTFRSIIKLQYQNYVVWSRQTDGSMKQTRVQKSQNALEGIVNSKERGASF